MRVFEHAAVTRIGNGETHTEKATIKAQSAILCTDRFLPELGKQTRRVYHAQTFLMASKPLSEQGASLIFPRDSLMVWDTDLVYQYFRLLGDNRLLFGGANMLYTYASNKLKDVSDMYRKLSAFFAKKFP